MKLAHRLEGTAALAAIALLRRLGPVGASNLCGWIARSIGPLLPVSKVAHRNLELAMPELDPVARRRIVRGVWDNLGRTAGELVHTDRLGVTTSGPGWEYVGAEHLEALVAHRGPGMIFTGHIGNWEIMRTAMTSLGLVFATLYRPSDNPIVDEIITDLRRLQPGSADLLFPKGAKGARQTLLHLRQGGRVVIVPDQKMNDGIEARFFARPAMTASGLASLALRTQCPVIPGYVQRVGPARFRVTWEPPLPLPATGDRAADVLALTQAVNDRLEAWIRAAPASWLWLHRRWPKECYADLR